MSEKLKKAREYEAIKEKQIDETPEEATKFSFADYLNNKAKREKYNDEDQLKSANHIIMANIICSTSIILTILAGDQCIGDMR